MLRFQVSIAGPSQDGKSCLATTFEQAFALLHGWERLFIEPDGSFVWTGATAGGAAWQVDGNLIDQGETLARVELKGDCPAEQFDRLLSVFGWPETTLAFELPRKGVCLAEDEFRKLAASETGAT